jgi:hypothetical protein
MRQSHFLDSQTWSCFCCFINGHETGNIFQFQSPNRSWHETPSAMEVNPIYSGQSIQCNRWGGLTSASHSLHIASWFLIDIGIRGNDMRGGRSQSLHLLIICAASDSNNAYTVILLPCWTMGDGCPNNMNLLSMICGKDLCCCRVWEGVFFKLQRCSWVYLKSWAADYGAGLVEKWSYSMTWWSINYKISQAYRIFVWPRLMRIKSSHTHRRIVARVIASYHSICNCVSIHTGMTQISEYLAILSINISPSSRCWTVFSSFHFLPLQPLIPYQHMSEVALEWGCFSFYQKVESAIKQGHKISHCWSH